MDFDCTKTSPLCSDTPSSFITNTSLQSSANSSPQSSMIVDGGRRRATTNTIAMMESAEDISTVMSQVLNRMERIVEHFRKNGENEAANVIARNTIAIITVFNETIAPWDMSTSAMRVPLPRVSIQQPPSSQSHTDHQQSTTDQSTNTSRPSWAAIAAVAPAAGNRLVKFTPDDTVQVTAREIQVVPPVPEMDSDKRVVWIRGWSADKSFSEITDKVGQGPVYSMAYSEKDNAVCIIFQYAYSAQALCEDDLQFVKNNGHSRFGPGCDVFEGLSFPNNDDLRRMTPPHNERRRLTFARCQLFTHGMTEEKFKAEVHSLVGERNVELVWLFNSGNATVVFSAMPLARMVRNHFIRISKNPSSPYHGVSIGFSHDPCERPMTLITQMQSSRALRPATTYGCNGGAMPAGMSTRGGSLSRRNTVGEVDGWQTVHRRR